MTPHEPIVTAGIDVGSGAGRVALHLQGRGLEVTAIDNSPLALEVCRRRGVKRTVLRPIEEVGRFPDGTFDTVVLFGNNLGLLGGRAKARRLLRVLRRICRDGALILAGTLDPHATEDPVHLAYHRRNLRRGRMAGQVRIRVRFRDAAGPWFDYLFLSRGELRSLLAGTGWRVRRTFGGKGPHYVAVLEGE
ncbi:MAG: class I SAM-dependent methyltransferase [Planctomycetaceae bacterium]|nr:class I SAM-dependent methyltransferase [Planctomycetaceae bacterium]